jgi:hypothetical protein
MNQAFLQLSEITELPASAKNTDAFYEVPLAYKKVY